MIRRSMAIPTAPATRKAIGTATSSAAPGKIGALARTNCCTTYVVYAPIITISPCAILITPMTPNVMASPMAASSSTEPSDSPYQTF